LAIQQVFKVAISLASQYEQASKGVLSRIKVLTKKVKSSKMQKFPYHDTGLIFLKGGFVILKKKG